MTVDPALRRSADLVTILLSREITNRNIVVMGTGTPLTAVATLTALTTHAPDAYYTSPLAGGLSIAPHELSLRHMEDTAFKHAVMRSAQIIDLWELATINPQTADRWLQFFRPAQMDAHGNINNSRITRPDGSVLQLPGSVGISDMAAFYPRLFAYVPRHERACFPRTVDFVSAPGTMGTAEERRSRGLRWGRPYRVITNLCTFEFADDGRMVVSSLHPGVSIDEVADATGFDVTDPGPTARTATPTRAELDAVDLADPHGVRFLEVLSARARRHALREVLRSPRR